MLRDKMRVSMKRLSEANILPENRSLRLSQLRAEYKQK
jgi:hypothetical protein